MTMKIEVDEGEISQFSIGDISIPLKKKLKLSEAKELENVAKFLEKHVDLSKLVIKRDESSSSEEPEFKEWSKDELIKFLNDTYSKKQLIFLKELTKKPNRLNKSELKAAMEREKEYLEPYTMAGILSCFSRRRYRHGKKEDFWISEWDPRTEEQYYILKEKYRKIISDYFKEELNGN